MVDEFNKWIEENKDLIKENKKEVKEFVKEKIETLLEGKNLISFDKMTTQPTFKEFFWESTGVKRVRWFYHFKEYSLIIPDSVHWRIVDIKKKYGDKIKGVEIEAKGEGKKRRYENILPIFEDIKGEINELLGRD